MSNRFFELFKPNASKPNASKESASPEVAGKLEHARVLSAQGQLPEAAEICHAILELQADHIDALMLYAEIAARRRDPGRAIELYSRVTQLQPEYGLAHYKRGNVLKDCGQLEEAVASYDRAVALDPGHANAFCNRGTVLESLNRLDAALDSYERAIALSPTDPLVHYNRGNLLRRLGRLEESLASYAQAILAKPDYAEAHFNRATLLKELRRSDEALASYDDAIQSAPGFFQAHLLRGALLRDRNQTDAALASYDRAIEINPRFAEAYSYRGALLHAMKQPEAALASYNKAIEIDPGHAEAYYNRGVLLQEGMQSEAAMADYLKTIELIPHFSEAHLNRGVLLHARKQTDAALASYDKAVEFNPHYAEAFLNRGILLLELGRLDAALDSLDRAIALAVDSADAHYTRGEALFRMQRFAEAVASFDRVLAINPNHASVLGRRRQAMMALCDWRDLESDIARITADILGDRPLPLPPLPISALMDEPSLQHQAARIWAREHYPSDDALGAIPRAPRRDRIHVGYFSADFRNHSVARLTAELFELHDRSRFEITAFAFGPEATDPVRARLEGAFDRFLDVRDRSDRDVAALSRELGIDIAVDLGGFTEHNRTKIFALRAAPIQLSYLGYLGTLGAPYMDYLVADPAIIPPANQVHYSEKIIYLPCYQVNDSQRAIGERTFARDELGLPPKGFVFSCFNTIYKLQPPTFETWMRILKRVKDSTLFIYAGNATAEHNLLVAAERSGVASQRIVFAKHLAIADYLARFRAMDLFLDTWPYNAGTTASDALWAGLPVLTFAGQSFASRCAASLLQAINLPELITGDSQQYEDLAVHLATNPGELADIRRRLQHNRNVAPLFNTALFARNLESAYAQIWRRYQASLPPDHVIFNGDQPMISNNPGDELPLLPSEGSPGTPADNLSARRNIQ
jgi:predicted O-linked N-acetylglucosamine transferase (SPINDLY family)